HAQTHSVVLPHAIAYNAGAAAPAMRRISRALGQDHLSAAGALYDLAQSLGAPLTLQELGLSPEDLDQAADIAASMPYWNPRALERGEIRTLLQAAFDGQRPA